jgi:hypothetical protein
MLKKILVLLSAFPLIFSQTTAAQEQPLEQLRPFKASYTLLHKKDQVGLATRELQRLEDGSYQYSYKTDLQWLIFSDKRQEISTLKILGNQVIPLSYEFIRKGTGKDKHYHWRYNRELNTASNLLKNKDKEIDWVNGVQDKLSYHLQSRLTLLKGGKEFNYSVFNHNGNIDINRYQFEYAGQETLFLPFGMVEAIKLKREIPKKKKATYAWFAPELDFMLVKLYHQKGGFEQFEAQLSQLEYSQAPTEH